MNLATRPADCVEIADPRALHVDDEVLYVPPGATASMRIQAAAVHILMPPA